MGAPLAIRQDIPAEKLRRWARLEVDGRIACWLIEVDPIAGTAVCRAKVEPRTKPVWTGTRCAIG